MKLIQYLSVSNRDATSEDFEKIVKKTNDSSIEENTDCYASEKAILNNHIEHISKNTQEILEKIDNKYFLAESKQLAELL